MNILFLMIAYPDVNENSNMYTDLTEQFSKHHNVVTVAPSLNGKTEITEEGQTRVLRVKTNKLFNVNAISKGIANIKLPYQYARAIKNELKGMSFDLIISPTPPITLYSAVKSLKKRFDSKHYLILRDIFPANAKDLGIMKNPLIYKYFRWLERRNYALADYIGGQCEGNIKYICNHNSNLENKVHVLENWIKVKPYYKSVVDYKEKYGLKNKFVAILGGNIGVPQQADFIIDLAESVDYLSDVIFLIIGNGTEKQNIVNIVREKQLSNVIIKDHLPRKDYQELVKQCDIGLVNLSNKFTYSNIPSRTLAYFEAKIPILAAVDDNEDYFLLLKRSKAGYCSVTGDLDDYKNNFLQMYNNREKNIIMGENGYVYLQKYMSVEKAYLSIMSHIKE